MRVERVLAPNPGPFTGSGTNTWLLDGYSQMMVIDPGPIDPVHHQAIIEAVGGRTVSGVLVTHTHPDHAPLANPLAGELGVPALGHAPGPGFDPDERLVDGARLTVGVVELEVLHTPGHSGDHLCFLAGRVLFSGDHIIGGSSVMVEDMTAYLASLERLRPLDLDRLYPGHGEVVDDPAAVIDWYVAHRLERQRQVQAALAGGSETVREVVEVVYREVDPALHPLAAQSVAAHLRKLAAEGSVVFEGEGWEARAREVGG